MDNPIVMGIIKMAAGMLVSFTVSGLKKVPFVREYPKIVATVLSILLMIAAQLTGVLPGGVLDILVNALTALAASVATYEIAKPVVAPLEPTPEPEAPQ